MENQPELEEDIKGLQWISKRMISAFECFKCEYKRGYKINGPNIRILCDEQCKKTR
jgi:hypothetical protein